MAETPARMLSRRTLLIGAVLAPSPAFAQRRRIVTVLGDSITAGLGLPAAQALPAQLELSLAALKSPARVRGAGVSGDTTAGGLARVGFSVQKDTDVAVVALGGNDLLQGLDPKATQKNLDRIVKALKARKIAVVLAGIGAPAAIGRNYARDFNAVFVAVAKANGVALYPDLMAGLGGDRAMRQRDGVHPSAAGVRIIAARLAPVVARELAKRR